ncbi:MAG: hypothetical protein LCH41_04585 [Armatimonadetes bacterium]|nr:hypothetical protein [Armatimonadota bacterium]
MSQLSLNPATSNPKLRADFARTLSDKVQGSMGKPGSEQHTRLEAIYQPLMSDGKIDLEKLPEPAQRELRKLQKASEDFEAFFVKGLMSQMRRVKFGEQDSQVTQFAKDIMDDAMASQTARGSSSIGIGKTVFLSMGETIVKQAIGDMARQPQPGAPAGQPSVTTGEPSR